MGAGNKAKQVARMGLLFALAICLSYLEGLLPPLLPVAGLKLGLSNIVMMYAVFLLRKEQAFALAVLKGCFAAVTRGATAGLLSGSGGLLSVAAMYAVLWALGRNASYTTVSVSGAVAHNIGQLTVVAFLLRLGIVSWYYLPVMAAGGIGMGLVTAVLLRAVMPWIGAAEAGARSGTSRLELDKIDTVSRV